MGGEKMDTGNGNTVDHAKERMTEMWGAIGNLLDRVFPKSAIQLQEANKMEEQFNQALKDRTLSRLPDDFLQKAELMLQGLDSNAILRMVAPSVTASAVGTPVAFALGGALAAIPVAVATIAAYSRMLQNGADARDTLRRVVNGLRRAESEQ